MANLADGSSRSPARALTVALALALGGCGGSGHGTMMAGTPDAAVGPGGGSGSGGAGGAGAAGGRVGPAGSGGAAGAGGPGGRDGGVDAASDVPININLTIDQCPTVVADATPVVTSLGSPVNVNGSGADPDDDPLTYQWSAATGTFANPAAASTSYTCAQAGDVALTVTVSDRKCDTQTSLMITCQAAP